MADTFQALGAAAIALLPGALYTWAFERIVGRWGVGLSDRMFRFVGVSALLHAAIAPITYWAWSTYVQPGQIREGLPLPLGLWALLIAYVAVPAVFGTLVGYATKTRRAWARWFTGPEPAPRAWDHLFAYAPDGWIRLKLKTGNWVGGAFARADDGMTSYAAGYPDDQDLYLAQVADLDPESGQFVFEGGNPVLRSSGLLIRWDEVEYLEFIEG